MENGKFLRFEAQLNRRMAAMGFPPLSGDEAIAAWQKASPMSRDQIAAGKRPGAAERPASIRPIGRREQRAANIADRISADRSSERWIGAYLGALAA